MVKKKQLSERGRVSGSGTVNGRLSGSGTGVLLVSGNPADREAKKRI